MVVTGPPQYPLSLVLAHLTNPFRFWADGQQVNSIKCTKWKLISVAHQKVHTNAGQPLARMVGGIFMFLLCKQKGCSRESPKVVRKWNEMSANGGGRLLSYRLGGPTGWVIGWWMVDGGRWPLSNVQANVNFNCPAQGPWYLVLAPWFLVLAFWLLVVACRWLLAATKSRAARGRCTASLLFRHPSSFCLILRPFGPSPSLLSRLRRGWCSVIALSMHCSKRSVIDFYRFQF